MILSTLHDPDGRFVPLIKSQRTKLDHYQFIIAHTAQTHPETLKILKKQNIHLVLGGQWGEARQVCLKVALERQVTDFFICDFDKILHWLKIQPKEFSEIINQPQTHDFFIFGRNQKTFATYPQSWVMPETALNNLLSRKINQDIDALASVCRLNKQTSKLFLELAKEAGWASFIEWTLIAHLHRLSIKYQSAKGLSWEDPDRSEADIHQAGSFKKWQAIRYDGVEEWQKRFQIALDQLKVFTRFP